MPTGESDGEMSDPKAEDEDAKSGHSEHLKVDYV